MPYIYLKMQTKLRKKKSSYLSKQLSQPVLPALPEQPFLPKLTHEQVSSSLRYQRL
jgi:hypothetical protein